MRHATLLFLLRRTPDGTPSEICLAMKKRGFGQGRWNGAGGKVDNGESIEDATKRETKEELGVEVGDIIKIAELDFAFAHKPEWNQTVHVYFCTEWTGEPLESEEMAPKWFDIAQIPYNDMWPDDIFWLPRVLAGDKVKAGFVFGEKDVILEQYVSSVPRLTTVAS